MTRLKHKTQKRLRGGSVPYLSTEKLGYKSPEDMKKDMDMVLVGCHGETTSDRAFFIVPANTYCMFTAHSGDPAAGDDPSEASYVSYGADETKEDYYKKLYSQLFTPYSERVATGRSQYKEQLYIYEPGDVIPDYFLSFKNTPSFIFMHGLYRMPVESLSGKHRAYFGQTKAYIRSLLDEGKLNKELLDYLEDEDRIDILTKSVDVLESEHSTYVSDFRGTPLYTFLEEQCCRKNPENLLFKPPFDQEELKENQYVLRLSEVLSKVKAQPGKTKRFFLLNFCRVTYSEYYREFKALARAVSFSGKCPRSSDRAKALNIRSVAVKFCSLSPIVKEAIVKTPEGQNLVRVLKKILLHTRGSQFWLDCIGDAWKKARKPINSIVRGHPLVQDYTGFMYDDEFKNLAELYPVLQAIQRKVPEPLKQQLTEFSEPFENVYRQLKNVLDASKKEEEERAPLLKDIYSLILEKINPKRFSVKEDVLYFTVTPLWKLNLLLEGLKEGRYDEDLRKIAEKDYESETNEPEHLKLYGSFKNQLLYDLYNQFSIYAGYPQQGLLNIPFKSNLVENVARTIYNVNVVEPNSNNLNTNENSNTNSNNNSSVKSYNSTKNGGGRKTRRRLVRKQKTRATAKNT